MTDAEKRLADKDSVLATKDKAYDDVVAAKNKAYDDAVAAKDEVIAVQTAVLLKSQVSKLAE